VSLGTCRRRQNDAEHGFLLRSTSSLSNIPLTYTSTRLHTSLDDGTHLSRHKLTETLHTPIINMFRRVATAVPSQAGRVLSTVARPNLASPIRTAPPTLTSAGRRQYHEKDKFHFCAKNEEGFLELVAMNPNTSVMLSDASKLPFISIVESPS
jgi:hypothetical protein